VLVCIYYPRGGVWPSPTAAFTLRMPTHYALHTCGDSKNHASLHHHIKDMFTFNHLLVYDNCYAISCHSLEWDNRPFFTPRVYFKGRCTKPYPPSLMADAWSYKPYTALPNRFGGPMLDLTHIQSIWHICHTFQMFVQIEASHEFSARTSKYIWNIFLQSPVKRQAQRITC